MVPKGPSPKIREQCFRESDSKRYLTKHHDCWGHEKANDGCGFERSYFPVNKLAAKHQEINMYM